MSIRVHDLAKHCGLSGKEMIEKLKAMNYPVKSVSSTVDNITAEAIEKEYGYVVAPEVKPEPPPVVVVPPPAPVAPPPEPPKVVKPAPEKPVTIESPYSRPLPKPIVAAPSNFTYQRQTQRQSRLHRSKCHRQQQSRLQ